jgi:hypothetical protein
MNPRYLILFTTLALLSFSSSVLIAKPDKCGTWPNCPNPDPDPDVTATYSAELIGGAFVFASESGALTPLTANGKGTDLSGEFEITVSQVNPVEIYDESACLEGAVPCPSGAVFVFNYHCPELVDDGVVTFDVAAGNWSIVYTGAKGTPGHVYLAMRNLENISTLKFGFSRADFDFDLHGDVAAGDLFPPPPNGSTTIQFTEYKLWAGVGGKDKILCNSDGRPDLISDIWLKITSD